MPAASHLIAIDWGTSSLRAVLMAADGTLLDRLEAPDGIMFTNGRSHAEIFRSHFAPWLARAPGAVALAAGMIGSRQGWVEAPYASCPAGFEAIGQGLAEAEVEGLATLRIVPGLLDETGPAPDVMRGEETQVFGALARLGLSDGLFLLPGTHSKWVRVEAGRICRFHTFMTGEVFDVMRKHTILGRLMPADGPLVIDDEAFAQGAAASLHDPAGSLLNRLFSVRARGLTGRLSPEQSPGFLSGVLIGEEIREAIALLGPPPGGTIHLICREDLARAYTRALALRGLEGRSIDNTAFAGLLALARATGLLAGG